MLQFTLSDGRCVQLRDLHILPSALRLTAAVHQPELLRERLAPIVQQFWPGLRAPFAVVRPGVALPPALCLASFTSRALALDECEGYSFLVVCWFAWHVERGVPDIIEEALAGLRWEEYARDQSGW